MFSESKIFPKKAKKYWSGKKLKPYTHKEIDSEPC